MLLLQRRRRGCCAAGRSQIDLESAVCAGELTREAVVADGARKFDCWKEL